MEREELQGGEGKIVITCRKYYRAYISYFPGDRHNAFDASRKEEEELLGSRSTSWSTCEQCVHAYLETTWTRICLSSGFGFYGATGSRSRSCNYCTTDALEQRPSRGGQL